MSVIHQMLPRAPVSVGGQRLLYDPSRGNADLSGNGFAGTVSGAEAFTPVRGRKAKKLTGAATDIVDFGTSVVADTDHCILWAVVDVRADQMTYLLGRGADGSGAGWSAQFAVYPGGLVDFGVVIGGSGYSATLSSALAYGRVQFVAGVVQHTNSVEPSHVSAYCNGATARTTLAGGTGLRNSGVGLQLGVCNGVVATSENPILAAGVCLINGLTEAEAFARLRSIEQQAMQSVRMRPRRIPQTAGGSSSLAASGSSTTTGNATPSVSYSLSAIGVSASGGNAAAQVAYDLAASHFSVTTGQGQPTVTATLGASALVESAGLAGIRPDVLVAAAGSALSNGNATLALQALHAAAGSATINGNATMAALINEAAAGVITTEGITALQAAIAALASGSSTTTGGATLSGGPAGSLNASGGSTTVGAANLDITLTLNASGADTTAGTVDPVSLTVALTAAGLIQAVGAGFLVISAPLEAFGAVATGGAASIVNGNVIVVIPAARRFGSRVVGFRPAALQARRRPSAH